MPENDTEITESGIKVDLSQLKPTTILIIVLLSGTTGSLITAAKEFLIGDLERRIEALEKVHSERDKTQERLDLLLNHLERANNSSNP